MTRKKDVLEIMKKQELTAEAVEKLEKRRENEAERNRRLDDLLLGTVEEGDSPSPSVSSRDQGIQKVDMQETIQSDSANGHGNGKGKGKEALLDGEGVARHHFGLGLGHGHDGSGNGNGNGNGNEGKKKLRKEQVKEQAKEEEAVRRDSGEGKRKSGEGRRKLQKKV